jgi:hypothetical protein
MGGLKYFRNGMLLDYYSWNKIKYLKELTVVVGKLIRKKLGKVVRGD